MNALRVLGAWSFVVLASIESVAWAAAPEETKKLGIGADAAFVLPVGNLADGASVGFGALAKVEYKLADPVSLTARIGFIYHLSKDAGAGSAGISEIPVLVGGKFYLLDKNNGLYAAAEVGFVDVMARSSVNVLGTAQSGSTSDGKFGLTLGAGYQLGALDFRAGLFDLDVGHFGDAMTLMANVGYTFVEL